MGVKDDSEGVWGCIVPEWHAGTSEEQQVQERQSRGAKIRQDFPGYLIHAPEIILTATNAE